MTRQPLVRLKRLKRFLWALTIAMLWIPPLSAVSATHAGRILTLTGMVDIERQQTNGPPQRIVAVANAPIESGDIIRTSAEGKIQILFADNSLFSLKPLSVFKVDEFRFAEKKDQEEEQKGFFYLVKGALRTISGLIGKNDSSEYQMRTPTATVGIRGTEYSLQESGCTTDCPRGVTPGLQLSVTRGAIQLANAAGSLLVTQGETAVVSSPTSAPKVVSTLASPPASPPIAADPSDVSPNNDRNESGESELELQPTGLPRGTLDPSQPNQKEAASRFNAMPSSFPSGNNLRATLDSDKSLRSINNMDTNVSLNRTTADAVETGSSPYISWGRWTNGNIQQTNQPAPITLSERQGVHYLVGIPSPTVPTQGTFSYGLLGATSPTFANGATAPGTFTGQASVAFSPGTAALIGLDANVSIGGNTFQFSTPGGAANPNQSSLTYLPSLGQPFQGALSCSPSCTTNVVGHLFGPAADLLGANYSILLNSQPQNPISGTSVFQKQP